MHEQSLKTFIYYLETAYLSLDDEISRPEDTNDL